MLSRKSSRSQIEKATRSSQHKTMNTSPTIIDNILKPTLDKFNTRWKVKPYLVCNVPRDPKLKGSVKVAAFDMDSTLIDSKSGFKWGRGPTDWKWWHRANEQSNVLSKVKELSKEGFLLVIFTNQGLLSPDITRKSYQNFVKKLGMMMEELKANGIDDVLVYASVAMPAKKAKVYNDKVTLMRKPSIGMWKEFIDYIQSFGATIDMENSFFVGDAAGRPGDHLDSDKVFAQSAGLKFMTPEEFFY